MPVHSATIDGSPSSPELSLPVGIPPALLEVLADLVAARLAARQLEQTEPYLGVPEAAAYLACPPSRLYEFVRRGLLAHHRDGHRLLFRRAELDAYVAAGGARRRRPLQGDSR